MLLMARPHSLAALWLAVSTTCAALNPTAFHGLLHDRFSPGGEWQVKRALRFFTFAETLRYVKPDI